MGNRSHFRLRVAVFLYRTLAVHRGYSSFSSRHFLAFAATLLRRVISAGFRSNLPNLNAVDST